LENLTPRQIVAELDKYIIGQAAAKRAVAVALRNRYRRQQLPEGLREEVVPKNILMIGPTGVGKTEIARRMAKLIDAPFIKVEATKFTEVGYVGRDVESIIRDLTDTAISMVHDEKLAEVRERAEGLATERIINLLVEQHMREQEATPARRRAVMRGGGDQSAVEEPHPEGTRAPGDGAPRRPGAQERTRQQARRRLTRLLAQQKLEDTTVEIDIDAGEPDSFSGVLEFMPGMSSEEMTESFQDFLENLPQQARRRSRKVSVREARRILTQEEAHKLIDFETVVEAALQRTQENGVVFLDELDKIAGPAVETGPDVSGEGVQRDLLPIVEGSAVQTRYGTVKTDHVLFIAAGAFHQVRPSDLIPELQGRFPLRVELSPLSQEDLIAILTQPENALTKQYTALLGTEEVGLDFAADGLERIGEVATVMNERSEDIGARRLHTIMEQVLEEISFEADGHRGETVRVDRAFVDARLGELIEDEDLSRFIL
jgi:ATP-dependent HslUV protease ATP-binding subunit HslU